MHDCLGSAVSPRCAVTAVIIAVTVAVALTATVPVPVRGYHFNYNSKKVYIDLTQELTLVRFAIDANFITVDLHGWGCPVT
jgi:hypothetical protein